MSTADTYNRAFNDGVVATVTLLRAGANPDDIACTLPVDPAEADRQNYQDHLASLRKILGTDRIAGMTG